MFPQQRLEIMGALALTDNPDATVVQEVKIRFGLSPIRRLAICQPTPIVIFVKTVEFHQGANLAATSQGF